MYKFNEETFNKNDFSNLIKNMELNKLHVIINDIITYQNWYDKSLTHGTCYFEDFTKLKFYKIEDIENDINHNTIINIFFEIYEWFLDDEDYQVLVEKLLNVILGYDKYIEIENYKKWIHEKDELKKNIKKNINKDKDVKKYNFKNKELLDNIIKIKNDLYLCDIDNNNFENILSSLIDNYNLYKKLSKNNKKVDNFKLDYDKLNIFLDNSNKIDKKILYNKLIKNLSCYYLNKIKNPSKKIDILDPIIFLDKQCLKCKNKKSINDFNEHKESNDGYSNFCLKCSINK